MILLALQFYPASNASSRIENPEMTNLTKGYQKMKTKKKKEHPKTSFHDKFSLKIPSLHNESTLILSGTLHTDKRPFCLLVLHLSQMSMKSGFI